jgi:hypothetical protein
MTNAGGGARLLDPGQVAVDRANVTTERDGKRAQKARFKMSPRAVETTDDRTALNQVGGTP